MEPLILESFTTQDFSFYTKNLTYGWKSNEDLSYDQGHWHQDIVLGSKYFPTDVSHFAPKDIEQLFADVQERIGKRLLLRAYINGYTFGTDAFAHQDEPKIKDCETAILYLNSYWHRNWGGETVLYKDGSDLSDITHSILPKEGRLLIFHGKTWHACRPLSRICPVLRAVLVFKMAPLTEEAKEITYLRKHFSHLTHSGGSFFDHLYRTGIILEKNDEPKNLVLAGMFHSIYGNDYFSVSYPPTREIIRSLIGHDAEQLVYEFNSMKDRTATLMAADEPNQNLLRMEIANLIEQDGRSGNFSNQLKVLREKLSKSS